MVLHSFDLAQDVIRDNEQAINELATTLIEQETLSGVALEALLSAVRPYDGELSLKEV